MSSHCTPVKAAKNKVSQLEENEAESGGCESAAATAAETVNSTNRPSPAVSLSHQGNVEEKIDDVEDEEEKDSRGQARQPPTRELIKNKEVHSVLLGEEADNRAGCAVAIAIDPGGQAKPYHHHQQQQQQRKRKRADDNEQEGAKEIDNSTSAPGGGKTAAGRACLKMKIKRTKKMTTRQSAARRVAATTTRVVDERGMEMNQNQHSLVVSTRKTTSMGSNNKDEDGDEEEEASIVTGERRCANGEMKRKLSASSSFTNCSRDGGLAWGTPAPSLRGSLSSSCPPRRRRSLGVLLETLTTTTSSSNSSSTSTSSTTSRSAGGGSSSAPASPETCGAIRSPRSSPAIIPNSSSRGDGDVNPTAGVRSEDSPSIDRRTSPTTSRTTRPTTEEGDPAIIINNNGRDGRRVKAETTNVLSEKMKGDKTKRHSSTRCSNNDQMPANKKLKTDRNRKDDEDDRKNEETTIHDDDESSFISATVIAPRPNSSDAQKEKADQLNAGTWVRTVSTSTEPDCFGPCEPGTSVTLEGIVWNETKGGILVLNVTWRGKTYVGTLLDCTKYDWAPPQPADSSGSSENDQPCANGWNTFNASNGSASAKSKGSSGGNGRGRNGRGNGRGGDKRHHQSASTNTTNATKTAAADAASAEVAAEQNATNKGDKKATATVSEAILEPLSPILFHCPFGKCEKKFAAAVGLKYHQTSSHRGCCPFDETPTGRGCNISGRTVDKKDEKKISGDDDKAGCSSKNNDGGEPKSSKADTSDSNGKVAARGVEKSSSQQSGSPVYSDISEDDNGQVVIVATVESSASSSTAAAAVQPLAIEKPMAIVEPQYATSSSVSPKTERPAGSDTPIIITTRGPSQPQQHLEQAAGAGAATSMRMAAALDARSKCPPLIPLERNADRGFHKPPSVIKLEPHPQRSISGGAGHHHLATSSSAPQSPRPLSTTKTQTQLAPVPPLPIAQHHVPPSPPPSSAASVAAQAQHHHHMLNQLNNHAGFMFNPFNPSGSSADPSIFRAALIAAGHSPSSLYGVNEAALAAAAGFPLGLSDLPSSSNHHPHHRSLGLMAAQSMASIAPWFNCSPSAAHQPAAAPAAPQPHKPLVPSSSNRNSDHVNNLRQQNDHHHHHHHVKRVTAGGAHETSVIVEALKRNHAPIPSPSPRGQHPQQVGSSTSSSSYRSPSLKLPFESSMPCSAPTSVIAQCPSSSNKSITGGGESSSSSSSRRQSAAAPLSAGPGAGTGGSPPVQRHVHTHHHTHTMYQALLAAQMDPYAAMVASQQAAANVINGYSPFGPSSKA